ncbi:winged helix-turn-helix transcriptional regulator [Candidatus Symbiobacter mobilis]|nr:winged helix-turn-helix transcriptional regulator [Candidatus Symbiobacter mobilis]
MMTLQSLDDLALLRESVSLECKLAQGRDGQSALPEDFWPTYSAMANTMGGVSDCRNRTMQQMFLMIGLGERAGSGMSRILHGWKDLGHDMRLLERYEPHEHTVLKMTWVSTSPEPDGVNGRVNDGLDTVDQQILTLIRQNPAITLPELARSMGKSLRTIERRVGKLKKHALRRIGSDKTGHWEVLP